MSEKKNSGNAVQKKGEEGMKLKKLSLAGRIICC